MARRAYASGKQYLKVKWTSKYQLKTGGLIWNQLYQDFILSMKNKAFDVISN